MCISFSWNLQYHEVLVTTTRSPRRTQLSSYGLKSQVNHAMEERRQYDPD
jgi:hypothetical protein